MASDFTKYTNYLNNAGVTGVVFGADSPILEVELNEMQEIQRDLLIDVINSSMFPVGKVAQTGILNMRADLTLKPLPGGLQPTNKNVRVKIHKGSAFLYNGILLITRADVYSGPIKFTEDSKVVELKVQTKMDNPELFDLWGYETDEPRNKIENWSKDSRYNDTTSKRKRVTWHLEVNDSFSDDSIRIGEFNYTTGKFSPQSTISNQNSSRIEKDFLCDKTNNTDIIKISSTDTDNVKYDLASSIYYLIDNGRVEAYYNGEKINVIKSGEYLPYRKAIEIERKGNELYLYLNYFGKRLSFIAENVEYNTVKLVININPNDCFSQEVSSENIVSGIGIIRSSHILALNNSYCDSSEDYESQINSQFIIGGYFNDLHRLKHPTEMRNIEEELESGTLGTPITQMEISKDNKKCSGTINLSYFPSLDGERFPNLYSSLANISCSDIQEINVNNGNPLVCNGGFFNNTSLSNFNIHVSYDSLVEGDTLVNFINNNDILESISGLLKQFNTYNLLDLRGTNVWVNCFENNPCLSVGILIDRLPTIAHHCFVGSALDNDASIMIYYTSDSGLSDTDIEGFIESLDFQEGETIEIGGEV